MTLESAIANRMSLLQVATVASMTEKGKRFRYISAFRHEGVIKLRGFQPEDLVTDFFYKLQIDEFVTVRVLLDSDKQEPLIWYQEGVSHVRDSRL